MAGWVNLLVSFLTLFGLIGGGYFVFKRWIQKTAKEELIYEEVKTSNGGTVGVYVEEISKEVGNIDHFSFLLVLNGIIVLIQFKGPTITSSKR